LSVLHNVFMDSDFSAGGGTYGDGSWDISDNALLAGSGITLTPTFAHAASFSIAATCCPTPASRSTVPARRAEHDQ
jgi:hypothetical protein